MPPSNSTGGDLVDQIRDWFEHLRDRVTGRPDQGNGARPAARRATRRVAVRSQAVPLGSYQPRPLGARRSYDRRAGSAGRADRAERSTYTLVFAAVLVALVVALFFTLSWLLGSGGPFGSSPSPTPTPNVPPGQLPNPAAISSPPPFIVASPSPSPDPGLTVVPQGRIHVVEAGDTLNRIAQRYSVTVDAIMQANNRTDRNQILRIGERLVIPDPPPGSPVPR